MTKKLITPYMSTDQKCLDDVLLCLASTIEDGLISAGAKSGEYTRLDLFALAAPFALSMFNNPECDVSYTTGYPHEHHVFCDEDGK
ncbi:hypothetical protein Nit79A3_2438 [Nitrosomonas sp. Is79A3]|uniref:hypothetical protein n=1 Tax=Nitrosomonas sp. (strain Is79A3) TaxID=261292 RepID=UPI000215CAE5